MSTFYSWEPSNVDQIIAYRNNYGEIRVMIVKANGSDLKSVCKARGLDILAHMSVKRFCALGKEEEKT